MIHLFLIDPLEKLIIKKDSSLLTAITFSDNKIKSFVLFIDDLYINNFTENDSIKVYNFEGTLNKDFSVNLFLIKNTEFISLNEKITLHMRLDPPFNQKYLNVLWLLDFLQFKYKLNVINSSKGILLNNEKINAIKINKHSAKTFLGTSIDGFLNFIIEVKSKKNKIILKPLNFFQGIGVDLIDLKTLHQDELIKIFQEKIQLYEGPILAQEYLEEVQTGEIRTIWFRGKELANIIKIPKSGSHLANIAQGASYHSFGPLEKNLSDSCRTICESLLKDGIFWVAFDIIGKSFSEINVTCPGLLVEASIAHKRNLALNIMEQI